MPSLGLHLDDETIRVSVALRLGAPICEPHPCRLCARPVTSLGLHGLSCPKSAGRHSRHAHLNDVVRRSLSSAGFPAVLEPAGLDRGDGRRPDGLTVFPFREGKCLTWDVTCVDTFADTVVVQSALGPGAAARQAEERKRQRYADLSQRYIFEPVALETSGVYGPAAAAFVQDLGRRISARTGERRETAWLRQRLSIAIVRGNAASVLATAPQQRWSQPRRCSPGCESESPSLRRMSGPPRRGDGTPQPSDAEPTGLPPSTHGADRSGRGNEQQHLRSAVRSPRGADCMGEATAEHQQQMSSVNSRQCCEALGISDGGRSRFTATQQMQLSPSPEREKPQCRGRTETASDLQLIRTIRPAHSDKRGKNPFHNRESLLKVKGLINLGNTCYLNSVLQCLSQCHYLTHHLDISSCYSKNVTFVNQGNTKELAVPEEGTITDSLCDFLKQIHTAGTTATVSPSHLLRTIALKVPQFAGYDQQDAHELLRALMEQVRLEDLRQHQRQIMLGLDPPSRTDSEQVPDDLKARAKTLGHQVSHTTIDSIFSGQLVSLVVCQVSGVYGPDSPNGALPGPLAARPRG